MYNMMRGHLTGKNPPKADIAKLRWNHKKMLGISKGLSKRRDAGVPIFKNTFATNPYSSDKSVKNLSRIAIADMKINIPAKGFYLLLRTLEEPDRINAISTIVEDHMGDAILFAAYNLVSPKHEDNPNDVLPIGTIFILKEPYLKTGFSGDFLLRTDSPSDVIILSENHPLFEMANDVKWKNKITLDKSVKPCSAKDLKERGNRLFSSKNYFSALSCYLSAIKLLISTEKKLRVFLYLNISATYLAMECFELSQEYALKALALEPRNLKGLYRAGVSYYELRQFEISKRYFENVLSVEPNNLEGKEKLKKTVERLKEMTGVVNIEKLYQTAKLTPRKIIDCSDFVGPLKIVSSFEKRRYVEATEDIKPGTLIVVSKALICIFNESSTQVDTQIYYNSDNSVAMGEIGKAVQETCQLIYKNPKTFGSVLYDLPINDAFLDGVVPKPFCDETCREPYVDVQRVRKLLTKNGIAVDNDYKAVGIVSGQPSSCALFPFPSYINHCCLANSSWVTYNNIMVIHATKHIKAGQEITISHFDPLTRYSLKEREFNKRETRCECRLCESDRNLPFPLRIEIESLILDVERRVEIVAKTRSTVSAVYLKNMKKDVAQIEKLINDTSSKELKCYLALPYFSLSVTYSRMNRLEKALSILWKAINFLGFDKECIIGWSKGHVDLTVPEESLFTRTILGFIEFLFLYSAEVEEEPDCSVYLRALEVGHSIYRGATKQMVSDTLVEFNPHHQI